LREKHLFLYKIVISENENITGINYQWAKIKVKKTRKKNNFCAGSGLRYDTMQNRLFIVCWKADRFYATQRTGSGNNKTI